LILVIAEKSSFGAVLSSVLGARQRKDGYFEGNGYIVSWCIGHLVELAQPGAYDIRFAKWRYSDLPIIPDNWKYVISKGKEKQAKILIGLMNRPDVDTIVNACDCGREGELIYRNIYNYAGCRKKTLRLWVSSMEDAALKAGMGSLRPGEDYDRLYQSALCRARADFLVGINISRLFSVLYRNNLSVGRVQSPTLAMLAGREVEIQRFVKEPFYTPELDAGGFVASGEKMQDRAAAEALRAACDGKPAVVTSVDRQEKSTAPPKLYDLTTLQREANRLFGYTAQQTLDYAQALYEKRLATYPRSDCRYLPEDMAAGIPALVQSVAGLLAFINGTPPVDAGQVVGKVSDHFAVIPTQTAATSDLSALPEGERNILNMLTVRLICAVGEKHTFAETVVTLDCDGHNFTAKGKAVLTDGWKAYDNAFRASLKQKPQSEDSEALTSLPEISEGQAFSSVSVTVKEGFSNPPRRFSEDTLLAGMESASAGDMPEDAERRGLGTPATRASILERLIGSGFVERKAKNLVPVQKGLNLITVLPDSVKSPALTADWEHQLKEVEHGELGADVFMAGIAEFVASIVKAHSAPNPEHIPLFPLPTPKGEVVGDCPRCGQSVREGKPGFFCDSPACGFKLWKDNKFFSSKKKTLDRKTATALLTEGRVFMSGLYSDKTGRTYDADVVLDDTGGRYINFKLEFKKGAKK